MRNALGQFQKGTHWRLVQPFRDREWLTREYGEKKRSTGDIAREFKISEAAVRFWLVKHVIPRRTIGEARSAKHWGPGANNPMAGRFGALNPNWKGGVTPERQAFCATEAWKKAVALVWRRDDATCRRCGLNHRAAPNAEFHVHHIQPFSVRELRAEPSNLVLVCHPCHDFIHSRRNTAREHLPKK